jgi:diguanylate cyclase (GGDEF)-like protein/PAS domain S-box-containing protein
MGSGPTIGVLTPLAGGFYYGGVLTGIAGRVATAGGRMIAIQTLDAGHINGDFDKSPPFDSQLAWDHIEGFVVIVNAVSDSYLAQIRRAGKPIAMVSNEVLDVPCPVVMPDNRSGVRDAVHHLIEHGHSRIGFAGFLGQSDIRERYEAYQDALCERGIQPDPALFFAADCNDESGGVGAARLMLAAEVPSTAMVAGTDLNAIGILKTLRAAGLSLPADQAIVGFDDTEAAAHVTPILSSIKQDFHAVGALAADLVLSCLRGDIVSPGRRHITTSFIARESCGCSPWRSLAGTHRPTKPKANPRTEFIQTLGTALPISAKGPEATRVLSSAATQICGLLEAASAERDLPPIGDVRQSMAELYHLSSTPETAAAVVDAVRLVAQRAKAALGPAKHSLAAQIDDAAVGAIWALAQAQGADAYERDSYLLDMLAVQYDVSMDLLRGLDGDARQLAWLERTKVRAAVLGLWSAEAGSALSVAGTFTRRGHQLVEAGWTESLQAFPPASIWATDPGPGHMVFAVPVKSGSSDWGWLVTVGPVESKALTGRETLTQWAALLTVALDEAHAAAELKAVEAEWQAILQNSPDAIARYDANLRYQYLNAAAAAALGADSSDIVGRSDDELGRNSAVVGAWQEGLRQVLDLHTPAQVEFSEGSGADTRWYQARMVPQHDTGGAISGVLTSTRDLTALKRAELALVHQALHDSLTGLANRILFLDRLTQSIRCLEREPGRFAILFVDLDHFKDINDTLGHDVGDRLLVQVAQRLSRMSRTVDTVARFGGDEFVILSDKLSEDEDVRIIGERVVRTLAEPFFDGDRQLDISGSVGIVLATDPFADAAMLLRNSDAAMYQAKERGGNRFQVFGPELRDRSTSRQTLEADLRQAIELAEFRLTSPS